MKVPCLLSEATFADYTAVVYGDGHTQSYAELSAAVDACSRQLYSHGIDKDAIVSLTAGDKGPLLPILPALWRLEATAQLASPRLPAGAAARLQAEADVCLDAADIDLHSPAAAASNTPMIDLAAYVTQLPTSGSTAAPKLVVHRFGNHVFNALGANRAIPVAPHSRWLLSLPLHHVGGLGILFRCFLTGATVALPAPGEPLGAAIDRLGITHLSVVPTQLQRLLRDPCRRWPKCILVGGGPLPPGLRDEAVARELPLYTTYGLTEMASQVTTGNNPDDSGALLAGREMQLSDEQEILVRGACLSPGYWEDGAVADARDADGWFHTGDLGQWTNGRLRVFGRLDNMFVSGGENIHPEEIEQALLHCSGVDQAVVVARSDTEYGQRPVAFLDGEWTASELRRHLQGKLPGFKIPDDFRQLPPAGQVGMKPDRKQLSQLANS